MLIFVKKLGLVKKKWDLKGRLAIYADQHKDCEKIYNVTEKKLARTTEEKKVKIDTVMSEVPENVSNIMVVKVLRPEGK